MYVGMVNPELIQMQKVVRGEIEHLGKGDIYQSMFRNLYWNMRINSLSKRPLYPNDKRAVLKLAVEKVKDWAEKDGVKFKPKYDEKYF